MYAKTKVTQARIIHSHRARPKTVGLGLLSEVHRQSRYLSDFRGSRFTPQTPNSEFVHQLNGPLVRPSNLIVLSGGDAS